MQTSDVIINMYQNTKTAMQSINDLKPKVENQEFLNLLHTQEERYKIINEEIENLAHKMRVDLKDNNWFEKAKLSSFSTKFILSSKKFENLIFTISIKKKIKIHSDFLTRTKTKVEFQ